MAETHLSEPQKIIADITLMNNRFMNKVFANDVESTQLLLRIILNNDKINVKTVNTQQFIQNLYGHSAQLDILATDENGRRFNVEIQRDDEGAPVKRARYYSSVLDVHFLDSGEKYDKLNDVYVIFITEHDVLHRNYPIYNVERVITEDGTAFADGSKIVYVNASCRSDTPLGRLMQDFNCANPDKMHYKELADRVSFFKKTKEGEKTMTDIIELYAAKRAKEAAKAAAEKAAKKAAKKTAQARNIELAKDLLAEGESIERTVRLSKLSEAEVRELASKLTA